MKAYIITIMGATLLSAAAGMLAPDKWRGYVRIITGLVIISCIASPVFSILKSGMFEGFAEMESSIASKASNEENISTSQTDMVKAELKKRIDRDIEERMENEYRLDVTADCEISVNENGEIEGVESVRISGDKLTDGAMLRLCEVYGLRSYEVYND